MAGEALSFPSGGRAVAVERFDAAAGGRRPAILLLHGADGFTNGDRYRLGAGILAAAGYHVFLLHYLDRTGQARAYFSTIGQNFSLWAEGGGTSRDEIVVFEVMVEELDRDWWRAYRRDLEARFRQDAIVVRAQGIEPL